MRIISTLLFLVFFINAKCQLLSWSPDFISESSLAIEITADATQGNQGLKDYTPATDVYVHIGAITSLSANSSDWKYVKFANFNAPSPTVQCTSAGLNKWKFTITGGLRSFFGITNNNETIQKIAILFRNGAGTKVQRNTDGSDMYIPVYDAALHVRLDMPVKEPKYAPTLLAINKTLGDNIAIVAKASQLSTIQLYLNGTQVGTTATNATLDSANATITAYGTQTIVAQTTKTSGTRYDTISFFVTPQTTIAPLPAGLKDGINYEAGDTSVTLVLFAPQKTRVAVLGDFNNWAETTSFQMNRTPDSTRYWLRIKGLTPATEYAYQYLIDGALKVADYMTEKILDPANDPYITATTYPNLKLYPTGKTTGIVSILQTAKPTYNWQVNNFARPDKRNLVIYELLVRDFVAAQNWQTIKDSISYLKKLGINAIEVMPFNEFEGNNSWGYNPDFYFAPDKAYGTETALKQFIDECHRQGIAVIMDMVLNHSMGSSPMVQMYFDGTNNVPAANNPWFNQYTTHAYNVGYQFNHESAATKDFTQKVINHWLTDFHMDGYRFDLAKGFTQKRTCDANGNNCDVNAWSAYDQSRINIWDTFYKQQQQISQGSYCILEMFADNSEETIYANNGMMIWGNLNYNYNQATMGYLDNNGSNFQSGIYTNRNWAQPGLVTYQESHDEERLMYKNLQYGNSSGTYNVKDLNTALKRNEMATAFWAVTPAPKMVWQFGELGYDYSINTCEDLTISDQCRTSPKPVRWDYLTNPNRVALHDVYSKLFSLRNVPNFLPTFVTSDVQYNLNGAFKWLEVNSDSLKITVIGNFDVVPATGTVTFQNAGIWYNYLSGGTRTATGAAESITLQPGEYYVYINRKVDSSQIVLPLKLLSFDGRRNNDNNVLLSWSTANEISVKNFGVDRSNDGTSFNNIATLAAKNMSNGEISYNYIDSDPHAVKNNRKIFYRLKMTDIDGKYTYSNIAVINALNASSHLSLYPNPVNGNQFTLSLNEPVLSPVSIKIEDISGRIYNKYVVNSNNADGNIPVNVRNLANGNYIIKVETSEKTFVQHFIIQH